jgi:hypothetical protein
MRPTIYIPSRLTKLMARWALSLEDVLPALPDRRDPENVTEPLSALTSRRLDVCCCAS